MGDPRRAFIIHVVELFSPCIMDSEAARLCRVRVHEVRTLCYRAKQAVNPILPVSGSLAAVTDREPWFAISTAPNHGKGAPPVACEVRSTLTAPYEHRLLFPGFPESDVDRRPL